ncbi:hypothetical protein QBC35DRAFT_447345 [Podospora australis]|uniref:RGS domain-containing protein n=1 Tax=Podospora australis TaxID=1536484 RepID=A0AAN7AKX6_9PEZI|nr:hypothetical protein QBC35DRAFT_447345 [Podospora australis]
MGLQGWFPKNLLYRRPAHVPKPEPKACDQASIRSEDEFVEPSDVILGTVSTSSSSGIPEALSFDRIVEGGTCPPLTTRDFMSYLRYVEHSAENLQFYLWWHDYVRRFNMISAADLALAPEWTQAMEDELIMRIKKDHAEKARKPANAKLAAELFNGIDFEKSVGRVTHSSLHVASNPFSTPPETPDEVGLHSDFINTSAVPYKAQAAKAYTTAGVPEPFTVNPFREELDRIIATYIMNGSPRQLNLSDREQKAVLQALCFTTHPSALRVAIRSVESTLRQQAHPNFIRWSICNGNPPRVGFARGLGVGTILLSTIGAAVLTLSSAPRGYRALLSIGWIIGFATLIAAWKGMCVVLHGLHHRHIRPWELFLVDDVEAANSDGTSVAGEANKRQKKSFETFGSSNSYEDEPWVVKYEQRSLWSKIWDREIWIKEPALRQIQDTIFIQSLLFAVLASAILVAIFVSLPGGNLL